MSSRALWSAGDKWTDFRPLLAGEVATPTSFVSINRTVYVIDAANGWFRRATEHTWNVWRSDNAERALLDIDAATPCGLRLRWGRRDLGEFVSTTPIIAVFAGDIAQGDGLPEGLPEISWDDWGIRDHPSEDCGAMNCAVRRPTIVVQLVPDESW